MKQKQWEQMSKFSNWKILNVARKRRENETKKKFLRENKPFYLTMKSVCVLICLCKYCWPQLQLFAHLWARNIKKVSFLQFAKNKLFSKRTNRHLSSVIWLKCYECKAIHRFLWGEKCVYARFIAPNSSFINFWHFAWQ